MPWGIALRPRPSYHPATLLKIYLYGYLNRIASSRRLERETHRNMTPAAEEPAVMRWTDGQ